MRKTLLLLFISWLFAGCSLVQTGSVSRAYETYQEQDYERTLELISLAQKVHDLPPELNAELGHLKAQTYAQMGMTEKADNLFRHLGEHYRDTEYGYLAYERLQNSKPTDNAE